MRRRIAIGLAGLAAYAFIVATVFAWSSSAGAQSFPGDCYIDPDSYYCHYGVWGSSTPFHVKRVEIKDNGVFGFEKAAVSPAPIGTGASNGTLEMLWDYQYYRIDAVVDDLPVELWVDGVCPFSYIGQCFYLVLAVTLGDGWVLDNGIDFSGLTFTWDLEQGSPDVPSYLNVSGSQTPWTPFDMATYGPEANGGFGPLPIAYAAGDPVMGEHFIDDYFGIKLEVDLDPQAEEMFVPEPGAVPMLSAGCLALAIFFSSRARREP